MWELSSNLLSFVVKLNLTMKDGLDVIFIWTLMEKKDHFSKELVSEKAGRCFSVLGPMWNGFCHHCLDLKIFCSGYKHWAVVLLISTNETSITSSLIVLVIMLFCEPVENKCFLSWNSTNGKNMHRIMHSMYMSLWITISRIFSHFDSCSIFTSLLPYAKPIKGK